MSAELIVKKVGYLRKKYQDNKKLNSILSNILWYSFDVVYCHTSFFRAFKNNIKEYMVHHRIYKSCEEIISTPFMSSYLLTLTLNNDALLLSDRSLSDYVKAYTQRVCYDGYIFADYGKKNGRKHFHIIMCTYKENVYVNDKGFLRLPLDWQYGFYNLTPITDNDSIRYAKKSFTYAKKSNGLRWRMRKSKKFILPYRLSLYRSNRCLDNFVDISDLPEGFF